MAIRLKTRQKIKLLKYYVARALYHAMIHDTLLPLKDTPEHREQFVKKAAECIRKYFASNYQYGASVSVVGQSVYVNVQLPPTYNTVTLALRPKDSK